MDLRYLLGLEVRCNGALMSCQRSWLYFGCGIGDRSAVGQMQGEINPFTTPRILVSPKKNSPCAHGCASSLSRVDEFQDCNAVKRQLLKPSYYLSQISPSKIAQYHLRLIELQTGIEISTIAWANPGLLQLPFQKCTFRHPLSEVEKIGNR